MFLNCLLEIWTGVVIIIQKFRSWFGIWNLIHPYVSNEAIRLWFQTDHVLFYLIFYNRWWWRGEDKSKAKTLMMLWRQKIGSCVWITHVGIRFFEGFVKNNNAVKPSKSQKESAQAQSLDELSKKAMEKLVLVVVLLRR